MWGREGGQWEGSTRLQSMMGVSITPWTLITSSNLPSIPGHTMAPDFPPENQLASPPSIPVFLWRYALISKYSLEWERLDLSQSLSASRGQETVD